MNKLFITIIITALTAFFSSHIFAGSSHGLHNSENSSATMDHSGGMDAGHGDHASGMKIHTSNRDGYTFEYRLINMKEKMKHLKNMPEMNDSHHLMVFVKDSHGAAVKTAKVGYLIREKGSGAVQKKMAMGMNNGFGADVTLAPGNHYRIKTKVMAGGKKLIDEFKYMGGDH